jgi:serine/threonine protein kinase
MSSNGRPITQTWGYEPRLENGEADDEGETGHVNTDTWITSSPPPVPENRFSKPNHKANDATVPRVPKDEKLARTFPNRSYHHLMTIEQAGPAVIGVDDTDERKRVAIKRVRKPEGSVHQVPPSTCEQIVNIKDMYIENDVVVFVYEQMDVSLRHMTGILQGCPLKAFQIAAICREVSANVDQFGAYHAHRRQVVSGLLYMHEELGLAHGALNCSTILLDLNGRVKIGKF